MVTTVAPAGGRKVDAGGLGVYAVRVTVTPLALVWVRMPLELAAQNVTGVGWDWLLEVTQVDASPPYVPDEVVTLTPAAWASASASMALSDLARTPGEKRSVKPSTASPMLDGTLPQVALLPVP
jgi:hypothetical protein